MIIYQGQSEYCKIVTKKHLLKRFNILDIYANKRMMPVNGWGEEIQERYIAQYISKNMIIFIN
jgi:hypothetical protein